MTKQLLLIPLAILSLTACNSLEGTFEPDCMAFEGDRVVFANGRYEWHKFTDERRIDDDGNVIEPFPGYPSSGRYTLSRSTVEFVAEQGAQPGDMYLFETDTDAYLLTREHNAAAVAGDGLPTCPLRLKATNSPN